MWDAAERQVFAGALDQKPGHNRGSTNVDHNRGSTDVDQRLVSDGWVLEQKPEKCNRQNLPGFGLNGPKAELFWLEKQNGWSRDQFISEHQSETSDG